MLAVWVSLASGLTVGFISGALRRVFGSFKSGETSPGRW